MPRPGPEADERVKPEEAFGRVLREIRNSKRISQERLAFESGLHPTYISLLERGLRSPSLKAIVRLSTALELRPSDLLARVEGLMS